jgi:hypothetical protein
MKELGDADFGKAKIGNKTATADLYSGKTTVYETVALPTELLRPECRTREHATH